jgi:hypothetical protein
MNRRKFLSWMGIGAAVAVAAPSTLFSNAPDTFATLKEKHLLCDLADYGTTYGDFCNYSNFSAFAITSSIDDCVANAAAEMSYRAGLSVRELTQVAFDV